MAAIAYVWNERKQVKAPVRNKVCVFIKTVDKSLALFLVPSLCLSFIVKHYAVTQLTGDVVSKEKIYYINVSYSDNHCS